MNRTSKHIVALVALASAALIACSGSDSPSGTTPEIDTGVADTGGGKDSSTTDSGSIDTGGDDTGGGDTGDDGGGGFDCAGKADGTACGSGLICKANACVTSICGDGYVDTTGGEQCEDGNADAGDGCSACKFDCNADTDCNDGNSCTTDTCDKSTTGKQLCKFVNAADSTACTLTGGESGTCKAGTCAKAGCGNGSVDTGEECDDGNTVNNDGCTTSCKFTCHNDGECDDGNKCNGTETCNTTTHRCVAGTAVSCAATGCATAGTCDPSTGACTYADLDKDGVTCNNDCNDADPTVFPGAFECKDGKDNDCSTSTADSTAPDCLCYRDYDGDGYAPTGAATISSAGSCPSGYTRRKPVDTATTDCYDANNLVYPNETTPAPNYGYYTSAYCIGKRSTTGVCLGTLSYDYNCNGTEQKFDATIASSTCVGATSYLYCTARSGWISSVPACGVSGTYRACTWNFLTGSCTGTDAARKQGCK